MGLYLTPRCCLCSASCCMLCAGIVFVKNNWHKSMYEVTMYKNKKVLSLLWNRSLSTHKCGETDESSQNQDRVSFVQEEDRVTQGDVLIRTYIRHSAQAILASVRLSYGRGSKPRKSAIVGVGLSRWYPIKSWIFMRTCFETEQHFVSCGGRNVRNAFWKLYKQIDRRLRLKVLNAQYATTFVAPNYLSLIPSGATWKQSLSLSPRWRFINHRMCIW